MLRSSVALAPVKTGKNVTSVAHSIPFHQFQSSPDYRQTVVLPPASELAGITPGKPQFTLHFSLIFITSVSLTCCVMTFDDDAVFSSRLQFGSGILAVRTPKALLQSSEDLMKSLLSVSTPTKVSSLHLVYVLQRQLLGFSQSSERGQQQKCYCVSRAVGFLYPS